MRQHPEVTAVLEGHTDSKGNAAYNQRLSEQRAQAVKDKMVNQYGISSQRLMAQGYGESRPVATNDTEQGRQENRRVVAIISQ
jgi:OOP family OmpA-OmpF porin